VADLGGAVGAAAPLCTPLGVLQKNSSSTDFENSETADGAIIIITNFYLAAYFLKGRRERGHEGAWGTPKAPAAARTPLAKFWIRHCT